MESTNSFTDLLRQSQRRIPSWSSTENALVREPWVLRVEVQVGWGVTNDLQGNHPFKAVPVNRTRYVVRWALVPVALLFSLRSERSRGYPNLGFHPRIPRQD